MSGIAGIIHFDGRPVERAEIEAMTSAMAHRGPDDIRHYIRGGVALGHCMLRTTPESLEETQPLANEDESVVLVMDGRVDNWEELRTLLVSEGARLRTRADAELVLRAYERWREDCLQHIDGDFALVIWDARLRRAFCARDRVGHKPLFFHFRAQTLVFASDVKPILDGGWVCSQPNEGIIAEVLSDTWYSKDETIWKDVFRIEPAQQIRFGPTRSHKREYWLPEFNRPARCTKDQDFIEQYRALLFDTVRRQSRSHRPVSYEVSGGLDSSAIFCVAEFLRRQGELPAPAIDGFTLDFRGDPAADELSYAHAVRQHLGVTIHEIRPCYHELTWFIEEAKFSHDFPLFPNGALATGLYEQVSQSGSRVILGGIGGDHYLTGSMAYIGEEIRQGNFSYVARAISDDARTCGYLPAAARALRHGTVGILPYQVRQVLHALRRGVGGSGRIPPLWLSVSLREQLAERKRYYARSHNVRRRGQEALFRALDYPFDILVRDLMNRLSSRYEIEIRQPFLSKELIQLAFDTPDRMRTTGCVTKIIHRRALSEVLPKAILLRHSKADLAHVFDRSLAGMEQHLTGTVPQRRSSWLTERGMRSLWDHYRKYPECGWQNWCLWNAFAVDIAFG